MAVTRTKLNSTQSRSTKKVLRGTVQLSPKSIAATIRNTDVLEWISELIASGGEPNGSAEC